MSEETEWAPKQDMSLLCRVCANQHDYLIPIFQGEGLDHDMPTKMDKHLPIKVRENDKLPTQMCYQCASTIIAWSELHTNCLAADKKLKGMLKINEKKSGEVDNDDAASDHYEDSYDDGGGAGADDDEDFEQEIKQLISDAGVELGQKTTKATKRPSRAVATRKRKAEVTITPVKREPKKLKTEPKSSTALLKPKEEVVTNDDRRCEIWICCTCDAKFISSSDLIQHVICLHEATFETNNGETMCPMCYLSLDTHISLTEGIREFQCYVCRKSFTNSSNLNLHLRIHSNDKRYVCEICGASFVQKASLASHKFTHLTSKIMCDVCGNVYKHPKALALHKRIVHLNRPQIVCEVCGKEFKLKARLRVHMAVHFDDRPYSCNICSSSFKLRKHLTGHLKIHLK